MDGLINWLTPETIQQTAGAVTAWADSTGRTENYAQGTGANQPVYISSYLNGLPGVNFDSTAKNMSAVNNNLYNVGQNSFLWLMVGEWSGASNYYMMWSKCDTGSANHLRCGRTNTDTSQLFWGADASNYAPSALTWPATTPRVIGWGVDAAAAQSIYVSNGTINRAAIALSGTGSNALTPRLNGDLAGTYTGTFKMAEAGFYARGAVAFSDTEIARVVTDLRAKYNI